VIFNMELQIKNKNKVDHFLVKEMKNIKINLIMIIILILKDLVIYKHHKIQQACKNKVLQHQEIKIYLIL